MHRSNQVFSCTWHDLNVEVRERLMDKVFLRLMSSITIITRLRMSLQFSSGISLHYQEACVRRAERLNLFLERECGDFASPHQQPLEYLRYIKAFYCHETVIRGKCFLPDRATRPWIRHYSTAGLAARRFKSIVGWWPFSIQQRQDFAKL
jgi:hypothetical protein